MNIDIALAQVISLRRTSDDLQRGLNILGSSQENAQAQADRMFGYLLSAVILRALATELILKLISFRKTGDYKRCHDLLDLLNDLDSDTMTIVSDIETVRGVAPLTKILGRHKSDFVETRYLMESPNDWSVGLLDLNNALTVLLDVYKHKEFVQACKPNENPKHSR